MSSVAEDLPDDQPADQTSELTHEFLENSIIPPSPVRRFSERENAVAKANTVSKISKKDKSKNTSVSESIAEDVADKQDSSDEESTLVKSADESKHSRSDADRMKQTHNRSNADAMKPSPRFPKRRMKRPLEGKCIKNISEFLNWYFRKVNNEITKCSSCRKAFTSHYKRSSYTFKGKYTQKQVGQRWTLLTVCKYLF